MNSLKYFLELGQSPVGLITIFFVTGFLLCVIRRGSRAGQRLVACGAGLFLLFLCTPIAEALYGKLESPYLSMMNQNVSARHIVVLAEYGHDFPFLSVTNKLSVETISRMAEGIRLYRALPEARLILSGGVLSDQARPIADLMADFAIAMGVPDEDIVVETKSTTTYENLFEVHKIIGSEPFVLVTSSGHMRRAEAVARKLDMRALPAPVGIWALRYHPHQMSWMQWVLRVLLDIGYPKGDRLSYLQSAYHEYLGYIWYRMLGRV